MFGSSDPRPNITDCMGSNLKVAYVDTSSKSFDDNWCFLSENPPFPLIMLLRERETESKVNPDHSVQ